MTSSPKSEESESGYGTSSVSSTSDKISKITFTTPHLEFLNSQLKHLSPQEIIQWSVNTIPSLYQETAFGLTGLCTIDMLSKLPHSKQSKVDLIFFDTLHHFPETLDLVQRIQHRYATAKVHVYQPLHTSTAQEFADKNGSELWNVDDQLYDWLAKVEPAQRAYRELGVNAVLTGRRRSQGGKRGDIPIIQIADSGLIKINPFASWTFEQVEAYIRANNVPYNNLLNSGYKSIGDWHSTQPVKFGEDERSGRWQGQEKTECGIHNPKSQYARFLQQQHKAAIPV